MVDFLLIFISLGSIPNSHQISVLAGNVRYFLNSHLDVWGLKKLNSFHFIVLKILYIILLIFLAASEIGHDNRRAGSRGESWSSRTSVSITSVQKKLHNDVDSWTRDLEQLG